MGTKKTDLALIVLCILTTVVLKGLVLAAYGDMLDGDEAILGIMSTDVLQKKIIPLFFYGQNYGLSTLEVLFGAASFLLFGVSGMALHIGILSLWIIGFFFWSYAAKLLLPRSAFIVFTIVLSVSPVWAEWAFKARGFYTGGFSLFALIFFIIARIHSQKAPHLLWQATAGILLGIGWHTSQLWFLTVLPLIILWLTTLKKRNISLVAACTLFPILLIYFFAAYKNSAYWHPDLFDSASLVESILQSWERVALFFSGNIPAPRLAPYVKIATYVSTSLYFVLLFWGACVSVIKKKYLLLSLTLSAALPLVFLFLVNSTFFAPRYLLPVGIPFCALLGMFYNSLPPLIKRAAIAQTGVALFVLLCIFTGIYVQETKEAEAHSKLQEITNLIQNLEDHDIRHAYCMDGLLQWQLIFYSKGSIMARWVDTADRIPLYPLLVDKALYLKQKGVVIGCSGDLEKMRQYLKMLGVPSQHLHASGRQFFWVSGLSPAIIQDIGFVLNPINAFLTVQQSPTKEYAFY